MEFDLETETKQQEEANEKFLSCALGAVKIRSQFLAKNFDALTPKEISRHLRELGNYGKILAKYK